MSHKTLPWSPFSRSTICLSLLLACGGSEKPVAEPEVDRGPLRAIPSRQEQLREWVAANHRRKGHSIVLTETLSDGTTVDWVDRNTVPGGDEPPPPTRAPAPRTGLSSQPATLQRLSGPPGALPFLRPVYTSFINGTSAATTVDEYVEELRRERGGNPSAGAGNRLYASRRVASTNYGGITNVNGDFTGVDSPTSPDFAIFEIASFCASGGLVTDLVGVTVGRNPNIYGAGYRFGAEYFDGGSANWISGGGSQGAYVQTNPNYAPGVSINAASVANGTQYDVVISVEYYTNATPKWWFNVGGNYVGYVTTGSAFTSLDTSACIVDFYGEVFDPSHLSSTWTIADLGSGVLPTGTAFWSNYGTRGYANPIEWFTSADKATWSQTGHFGLGGGN